MMFAAIKVNCTDESQVDAMIQVAMTEYGRLDLLVSNTAILIAKPVVENGEK